MKCNIFENDKTKQVFAVLFDDMLAHSQVKVELCTPISAGFVNIETVEFFGESESLKLKADKQFEDFIICTITNNSALLIALNAARKEELSIKPNSPSKDGTELAT